MGRILDITGQRAGRWTVLALAYTTKGRTYWLCRCDCGTEGLVDRSNLRSGQSQSCGCIGLEAIQRRVTHGYSRTPTYQAWRAMKERCGNPKTNSFHRWGGRGIRVCERWQSSFENFLADMGEKPPGLTVDRIDNDGDYEPGNCRWATRQQQAKNRSTARLLTFEGTTASLTDWAHRTGLHKVVIFNRLAAGWTLAAALTTPPRKSNRKAHV